MRLFNCIVLAATLALLAQTVKADPALECSFDFGSQIEIGTCVSKTEARVEQAVQSALGFARTSAKDLDEVTERTASVPALDAGQTAWETYRDLHCKFVGTTFGGGSGTGIAITACRVELGRERVRALMLYTQ